MAQMAAKVGQLPLHGSLCKVPRQFFALQKSHSRASEKANNKASQRGSMTNQATPGNASHNCLASTLIVNGLLGNL